MCTSAGAVCGAATNELHLNELSAWSIYLVKLSAIENWRKHCVATPASVFPDRFFSLSLSALPCSAPCGSSTFGCGFVRTHFGSAIRKSNVHNHRFGSSSVFILAFVGTLCVIFVAAGDYGQSHEQVMICTRESREREKNWAKRMAAGWFGLFGSKIEIKFTWLVVSFAMCTKWLQYTRSSLLSMRHTLMSASSLRFHNRIIPFHHVHVESQLATAALRERVDVVCCVSARIVFCSQRFLLQQVAGCSAPLCYFMYYIIYASLVLEHSSHYSPPTNTHSHRQQPHTDDDER